MLEHLNPKAVFNYFEKISNIPRGSKNEKEISDYLVSFAKKNSLEYIQDKNLNVIIKKPGTPGYENSKGVILQGHMDMVCEKNNGTEHNFLKDPIKLRIQKDMIYATETTLGADNGVAIAYSLAILESKSIPHPPIEVLITTEEEIGMGGAIALKNNILKGKYLINLDSEEEGSLLVSCCGGVRSQITLPIKYIHISEEYVPICIKIDRLKGGHSGMDIIKQRGNSNILIGRVLSTLLNNNIEFFINDINGGSKTNAIPRESFCNIFILKNHLKTANQLINMLSVDLKNEYKNVDDSMSISISDGNFNKIAFDKSLTVNVVSLLTLIPNGVITFSNNIENLPQSSTNLGIIETHSDYIKFESSIRSSLSSLKQDLMIKHSLLAKSLGGKIFFDGDYPEWEFSSDSNLRNVFVSVYKDMFKKEPNITAIHAGLECGIIKSKYPDLDIISFGPDHFDVHSPNEHLSISSTQRMWEYLLRVLKELK